MTRLGTTKVFDGLVRRRLLHHSNGIIQSSVFAILFSNYRLQVVLSETKVQHSTELCFAILFSTVQSCVAPNCSASGCTLRNQSSAQYRAPCSPYCSAVIGFRLYSLKTKFSTVQSFLFTVLFRNYRPHIILSQSIIQHLTY